VSFIYLILDLLVKFEIFLFNALLREKKFIRKILYHLLKENMEIGFRNLLYFFVYMLDLFFCESLSFFVLSWHLHLRIMYFNIAALQVICFVHSI